MKNKNFVPDFLKNKEYVTIDEKIYHYTSAEGLIGILKNQELWFTNIYFLNDNNEMFYTYKLILEVIEELKDNIKPDLYKSIKDRCDYVLSEDYLIEEQDTFGRPEYYIASFSLYNDSISLWNYYTKSNVTGYNLEFQPYILTEKTNIYGKVCYNINEQKEMLKSTIEKANLAIKGLKDERINVIWTLWKNFIIYSLFFKHENYKAEKEYRIIIDLANFVDKDKCSYRTANGLIIPYYKLKFDSLNYSKDDDLIKSIKISPIHQGNITKCGVYKLAQPYVLSEDITFSGSNMKF